MANMVRNPVVESTDLWKAFKDGDFYRLESIAKEAGFSRASIDATYRGFLQQLEAGNFTYGPATAKRLYCYAELARKYGLEEKADQLYGIIIKAHVNAGRKESAKRVRMVAGLTEDQLEDYINLRKQGKLPIEN